MSPDWSFLATHSHQRDQQSQLVGISFSPSAPAACSGLAPRLPTHVCRFADRSLGVAGLVRSLTAVMLQQRQLGPGCRARHPTTSSPQPQQHRVLAWTRSSSIATSSCDGVQQWSQHGPRGSALLARSAPEKVQAQDTPSAAAPPPPQRQFVRAESMTTMQEEQERELQVLTTQLPQQEQRFEWLAFWVASAVAFGAGIW